MYKFTRSFSFLIVLMFLSCGKDTPQPDKPSQPEPTKPIAVSSIEVENKELTMKPGQKSTLSYTVLPANATDKEVEIISSNADIISVSGKELTAIKIGKATITITSKSASVSAKINVEVTPIDAAELKLDKSEINLLVGDKETLVATITPEDASEKELTWKSGDAKVANVSATGEVEAVGPGETEITVSTKDGKLSATAKVTVTAKTVDVKSITLKPTELTLTVGSSSTITATVLPANATDKSLEWKSSAATIATVDSKGEVKAIKAGSTDITASTKDGKISATIKVTVTAKTIAVESISVKPADLSLTVGSSGTISATVIPANATDKTVKWKSSAATIASVDSKGFVKALKVGTAVITASSKDGKITASTKVSVTAKSVSVESISLNSTEVSLTVGSSSTIAATVLPSNATDKSLKWSSSAPTIASVDSKGVVKALKAGSADITASTKDGKVTAKTKVVVTVLNVAVESITLKPTDISITVLSSTTIEATVLPANATNKTLKWSSSAPTIATVDSKGLVKALKVGTAVITATTPDGKVSAKTNVVVNPILVTSIVLEPRNIIMAVESTQKISAAVLPSNASDKALTWNSNAPTIVSVDSKGTVKALKEGTAIITASTADGKIRNTVTVQVKNDVRFLKGKLSFSLVSSQFVTIGMQIYMTNQSNKAITIKKVEAYSDGALAATALSDFTQTIPAQTDEQWVIGFSQTRYSPVIGNFPPNWHAKVYFSMNGQNYAMNITNSGSSVQPIHQSTIGLNPDWDGENTTEIPSK